MAIQALIIRFGLPAIFVGAGLEGETAVIAGGILAHQHLLWPPGVAIVAAAGSFGADQSFFLFGRHFRDNRRVQRILEKPVAHKALDRLERHPIAFILGFRFLYGLRTVSPIAVGTSDVRQSRFLLLNGVAATLWASLFTGVGYGLGGPLTAYFHHSRSVLPKIIALLLVAGVSAFAARTVWKLCHRQWARRER